MMKPEHVQDAASKPNPAPVAHHCVLMHMCTLAIPSQPAHHDAPLKQLPLRPLFPGSEASAKQRDRQSRLYRASLWFKTVYNILKMAKVPFTDAPTVTLAIYIDAPMGHMRMPSTELEENSKPQPEHSNSGMKIRYTSMMGQPIQCWIGQLLLNSCWEVKQHVRKHAWLCLVEVRFTPSTSGRLPSPLKRIAGPAAAETGV